MLKKMNSFTELVKQLKLKENTEMAKGAKTKSGGKNPAIKSGNPAFKPTSNVGKKVTGAGNKLNGSMWRGTGRGK